MCVHTFLNENPDAKVLIFADTGKFWDKKRVIFMYFLPESLCIVIQAEGEVNAVMQVRHNVFTVEVIGFPRMDVHEMLFDLQRNAFGRFASFLAVRINDSGFYAAIRYVS